MRHVDWRSRLVLRILFHSTIIVATLIIYQNCAKVRFNREIQSVQENSLEAPQVEPELPDIVEVVTTTTIPTSTTSTTTMPTITVSTTVTTTTVPSLARTVGGVVSGLAPLPQIDFKFVVDNSQSMTANNTNVADAVGVMFSSSTGQQNLSMFNVTAEVFTTTQNNVYLDAYRSKNLFDTLTFPQMLNDDVVGVNALLASVSASRANQTLPISVKNPGDVIGYIERKTDYAETYQGISIKDSKIVEKTVSPYAVQSVVSNQLQSLISSGNGLVNNYSAFVASLKNNIKIINPNNTNAAVSGVYSGTDLLLFQNNSNATGVVYEESGLCAVARIVHQLKSKLTSMSAQQLADYKTQTQRSVFVVVSDENDDFSDGSRCLEKIYSEKTTSYTCNQDAYQINYGYDVNTNTPAVCKPLYWPNGLNAKVHTFRHDTLVQYNYTVTTIQCINKTPEGVCIQQGPVSKIQSASEYVSGDYTGANCTADKLKFTAADNLVPGSLNCTISDMVNDSNSPGAPDVTAVAGFPMVINNGVLSSVFVNNFISSSKASGSYSAACPSSLVDYFKQNANQSVRPYRAGFFDPSGYQYTNCQLNGVSLQTSINSTQVADKAACIQYVSGRCSAMGVDPIFCSSKQGLVTDSYTVADYGYTPPATSSSKSSDYFADVYLNPLISNYTCQTLCADHLSGQQYQPNTNKLCDGALANETIGQWIARKNNGRTIGTDSVVANVQCQSFAIKTANKLIISSDSANPKDCPAGAVLNKGPLYANENNGVFVSYLTGTRNSNGQVVSYAPFLKNQTNLFYGVNQNQPAMNLKDYIVQTVGAMVSSYGINRPIFKFLIKTPDKNTPESLRANGQSIGVDYIDFIQRYNAAMIGQYATADNLLESATAADLQLYYNNTFGGLTDSIRQAVTRAIPISYQDVSGQTINVTSSQIAGIDSVCIQKPNQSCVMVPADQYELKDLPSAKNAQTMQAYVVLRSAAAIALQNGDGYQIRFNLK